MHKFVADMSFTAVLYNVMQVARWSVKCDVEQDLTQARHTKNDPWQLQSKAWTHRNHHSRRVAETTSHCSWKEGRGWKRHFIQILMFSLHTFNVCRRQIVVYLSLSDHPADPRRHQRRDESLRGILYSFLGFAIQKMPQNCLRAMWNIRKRRKGVTARQ